VKKIPLKTAQMQMRVREDPIPLEYADTLLIVLEMMPKAGFTPAEMRARLPIADKIEAAQKEDADHVLLEDAQHKKLAALLKEYPFRLSHYALLEFVDAVTNAPEVEVEAKADV
jgi:hypothetical protein